MFFGKPTAKLRKLIKSRLTLAIAISLCVMYAFVQSGMLNLRDRPNLAAEAEFDKSGSGSGARKRNTDIKTIPQRTETAELEENMSNRLKTAGSESMDKDEVGPDIKTRHKSYLELVREANPPISVNNDRQYKTDQLKLLAQHINENQFILNKEKFPHRPKDGVVMVIQVHKRLEYLIELLGSLENVKEINDVLLIISSDWYSDSIVEAVKRIRFCQVMHIFFPFAEQFHPDTYPGTDPNDCPRDIDQNDAKKKRCNNADYPDKYGHYREAKFTMTKHHWWWKANVVFDKLAVTKTSNGPVVFLEEDHFVGPDFYSSLLQLHNLKQNNQQCNQKCDILNLGMYVKADSYFSTASNQVTITRWRSYDHNMGMTMYRSTWEKIKKCAKVFCTYDDYNWDWTLMHISMHCLEKPLYVLSMDLPRVFHMGECGMHHKGNCDPQQAVNMYKELIKRNSDAFFPKELEISNVEEGSLHAVFQNGGWGDRRDHELCGSFVKTSYR